MSLKSELEILRALPLQEKIPAEKVPCIERSDAEKLCREPVVSVCMITYNHESYIRRAIEGVMMQKTDFEFELVIGEDCSQDKTREICFEYQEKHPDRIRVLWWHENVRQLGGNLARTESRCRGEFTAFCEGDDCWTDPLKLQKQVDAMRSHPSAGFCFAGAVILNEDTGTERAWDGSAFPEGLIDGKDFFRIHCLGPADGSRQGDESFLVTSTVMLRKTVFQEAFKDFEILNWRMLLGDTVRWLAMAAKADALRLADSVSCYRRHQGGISVDRGGAVHRDSVLVRWYYSKLVLGISFAEHPLNQLSSFLAGFGRRTGKRKSAEQQRQTAADIAASEDLSALFAIPRFRIYPFLLRRGWLTFFIARVLAALLRRFPGPNRVWRG